MKLALKSSRSRKGFAREEIRRAMVADTFPGEVHWVVNERFERGSVLSLWAARSEMDEDVILMDADVLYCSEVLSRLVHSRWSTAVLMDETVEQETEECMVTGSAGRVLSLSKSLPDDPEESGEAVGFIKVQQRDVPTLLESVRVNVEFGMLDMEYEDSLGHFLRRAQVGYEKIGGPPWIEIDFPEEWSGQSVKPCRRSGCWMTGAFRARSGTFV